MAGETPFSVAASDAYEPGGNKATLTLSGVDV
jgi:hypothetical protein